MFQVVCENKTSTVVAGGALERSGTNAQRCCSVLFSAMASFHVRRLRTGSTQLETPRMRWVTAHTESVPRLLVAASFKARKTASPTTHPSSSRFRCSAQRSSLTTSCPKRLRAPGQEFFPFALVGSVPRLWAPQLRSRRGGLHLRRRTPRPSPEAWTPVQDRLGRRHSRCHSALKVRRFPLRLRAETVGAAQLHSKRGEVHFRRGAPQNPERDASSAAATPLQESGFAEEAFKSVRASPVPGRKGHA